MDVPQVATCIPGIDSVTPEGEDKYRGQMKVRVGPISLTFQGVVTLEERDRENWKASLRAEASDRRVGGGINATTHMTLIELSPSETELVVQSDARLIGKIGEFGQPLIRKKSDEMMQQFVRCVESKFQK
jgi:carbon monoxide dehydrogenase subunit G